MATQKERLNKMCPAAGAVTDGLGTYLEGLRTTANENRTAILELIDDHATTKTLLDEIVTLLSALDTKLNADTGVTDTDYDTTPSNSSPETLTASDPTAPPASLDT